MNFNKEAFAKAEIELGLQNLKLDPTDQKQKDRIAYWAIKIGDTKLAKKYSTSPKMKAMFKVYESNS